METQPAYLCSQESLRSLRNLLRRYPDFDDARAALAAELWAEGLEGDAETNWQRVDDIRYSDRTWLVEVRPITFLFLRLDSIQVLHKLKLCGPDVAASAPVETTMAAIRSQCIGEVS